MYPTQRQHEQLNADSIKMKSTKLSPKKQPSQKSEEFIFNPSDNFSVINSQVNYQNESQLNQPVPNSNSSLYKKRYLTKTHTPTDLAQPLLNDYNDIDKNKTADSGVTSGYLNKLSPTVIKKINDKLKSSSESTITFNENIPKEEIDPNIKKFNKINAKSSVQEINGFLKVPFGPNRLFNSSSTSGPSNQSKSNLQAQVYNFLERPTGWKCFIYHFTV